MDQIINFLLDGLNGLRHVETLTVGAAIVVLINIAFVNWLPNSAFQKWGYNIGKKISKKGRKLIGVKNWEQLENTWLGSIVSFFQGMVSGADEDDNSNNSEGD